MLIQAICLIAGKIADIVETTATTEYVNIYSQEYTTVSTLQIIFLIAAAGAAIGYALGLAPALRLKSLVNHNDRKAFTLLFIVLILMTISNIANCFAIFESDTGIMTALTMLTINASIVLEFITYIMLKNSNTFPELARKGAEKLLFALILSLAGGAIAMFMIIYARTPELSMIGLLMVIISAIIQIAGWHTISKSEEPKECLEETSSGISMDAETTENEN